MALGSLAIFSFTLSQVKNAIPTVLPSKRPRAMPRATRDVRALLSELPESSTPALANAKMGRTANVTYGCSFFSSRSATETDSAMLKLAH